MKEADLTRFDGPIALPLVLSLCRTADAVCRHYGQLLTGECVCRHGDQRLTMSWQAGPGNVVTPAWCPLLKGGA